MGGILQDGNAWRNNKWQGIAKSKKHLVDIFSVDPEEVDLLIKYLNRRRGEVEGKGKFGYVYAITKYCNLKCLHCGVNAPFVMPSDKIEFETTTDEAKLIIEKAYNYVSSKGFDSFFMFGGGEPTLRTDFPELLELAAGLFGPDRVGFCTNGTNLNPGDVLKLHKYVTLIETSIDGYENHHNRWRYPMHSESFNPYERSMKMVSTILADDEAGPKLEVASVVTKDNLHTLPSFAMSLREMGLHKYSVHRPMPVGRLTKFRAKFPTAKEYFKFFIDMMPLSVGNADFSFHLHHSLESIYSALLLGKDIHATDLPIGSGRHSIGIGWDGALHFDPWSLLEPYKKISPGNLLHDNLNDIMDDPNNILHLPLMAKKSSLRCKKCKMDCTGGMRFNAMSDYLYMVTNGKPENATMTQLVSSVSQLDNACPIAI